MKKAKKILILFLIVNILFCVKVFAVSIDDIELEEYEYTNAYKEYLQMTDEEKQKVMEPSKYDFGNNLSTNKAMMTNKYISLQNFMSYLRASAYSTQESFTLKDMIADNLEIRNQQQTNTCWAYSSMSSLETHLAMKDLLNNSTKQVYDFSERHMAYSKSSTFLPGQKNQYGFSFNVSQGGNYYMATDYLTNGIGAILEDDMPFENNEDKIDIGEIQNKEVQTTVDDIIYFDVIERTSQATDTELENLQNQMKEHISTYGSIGTSIYMPDCSEDNDMFKFENAAIYCDSSVGQINHGVSIIGWDDNFPKEKFSTEPKGDGAWIIRNSYGEYLVQYTFEEIRQIISSSIEKPINEVTNEMVMKLINAQIQENPNYKYDEQTKTLSLEAGKQGIFYMSYYDELIYSHLFGITNAENKKMYDRIYQHDEVGATRAMSLRDNSIKNMYLANVFKRTVTTPEYLTSVGIQTSEDGLSYEVYVNPTGEEKTLDKLQKIELVEGENETFTSGYHTLNFKNPCQLTGNSFVIVLKETAPSGQNLSFWVENNEDDANIETNANESFIGFEEQNEIEWGDVGDDASETYFGNLAIKGIVKDTEKDNPAGTNSKGSNFDNAQATLKTLSVDAVSGDFTLEIDITGIKVDELCDKYEHFFSITSKDSKTAEEITNKAGAFEKQNDGTYTLKIQVTSYEQLAEITNNTVNVFVKEIATKGKDSIVTVSKPMELIISTSEYNVKNNGSSATAAKEKNSKSPSILPATGIKAMTISIIIVAIIGAILYVKYRKLHDIK